MLQVFNLASQMRGLTFSEDQIDGGVEGICVSNEEDMLVAMCYVAECLTFGRPIEMEFFNVKRQRARITEAIINLLDIK